MLKVEIDNKNSEKFQVKVVVLKKSDKANLKKFDKFLSKDEAAALNNVIKQNIIDEEEGVQLAAYTKDTKIVVISADDNKGNIGFQNVGGKLAKILFKNKSAVICLENKQDAYDVALGLELGDYSFDKYFTTKKEKDFSKLEKVKFVSLDGEIDKNELSNSLALATSVNYARDLVNEPANYLVPDTYAKDVKELEKLGLKVEVLKPKDLEKGDFGLLLGVAKGSVNEPRVVVIKYNGTSKKGYDLGLVGKGVVFDTGGINIKPTPGMGEMKGDMAGSAAVVGAMRSIAMQKVKANVVGVIGLVENMPSDRALKPSDILVSKSGQTVEIGNTDAEGRLVLADCLTYIQEEFGVKKVIDIATLTGAAQMAFSYVYVPVLSNDDKFVKGIIESAAKVGDKMWQLPLDEEYNKMLKSTVADMNNISNGKGGGTITAACFLQRFIKKGVTWAHVDMAGVDFEDNGKPTAPKGASGFGVKMFNQVIKDLK